MSKRTVNVNVEYLTRVEGHGNIVVNVKKGILEKCELQIVEAPLSLKACFRAGQYLRLNILLHAYAVSALAGTLWPPFKQLRMRLDLYLPNKPSH